MGQRQLHILGSMLDENISSDLDWEYKYVRSRVLYVRPVAIRSQFKMPMVRLRDYLPMTLYKTILDEIWQM